MKKMNQSTKAKILATLSVLMIIFCDITTVFVGAQNKHLNKAMEEHRMITIYADQFADASGYLTDEVRSYASTGDKVHYDNYWREVNEDKNREKNVEAMKAIGITAEENAMVEKIAEISNSLVPLEDQAMKYVEEGDLASANALLYGDEYVNGLAEIQAIIAKLNDTIQARMDANLAVKYNDIRIATVGNYFSLGALICVQIYFVMFIVKELVKPILVFKAKLEEFAQGNLSGEITLKEDTSEIGTMVKSVRELQTFQKDIITDIDYLLQEMGNGNFNIKTRCEDNYRGDYQSILHSVRNITQTLSVTLSNINQAAEQVNCGADQMASGAQALSQGATEQAASVEELSATIDEISAQLKEAASHTDSANELVHESGVALESSKDQMRAMMDAMSNIESKSAEIGKIIKTIDDIAFQTNILALNAAVEAARAGAAGKGFAVVADEVRNLASKSAEAAKNTTALIDETVDAVADGTKIARDTEESVNNAVENFKKVGEIVQNIKEMAEVQSNSAMQISQGVSQIADVVQTNSATAEQSAAASEELAGQANALRDLIGRFKLSEYAAYGSSNVINEPSYSSSSSFTAEPAFTPSTDSKY